MKKSELVKLVREAVATQAKISGDVVAAEKAIDGTSTVNRSLLRINNSTEFYQGFKEWIQDLGISSGNNKVQGKTRVTKGTILSAVTKALTDLDWK